MLDYTDLTENILRQCAQAKDRLVIEELNELLKRGLLVWEGQRDQIVYDPFTQQISMKVSGRLILKDQKYIERLERENGELRAKLATLPSSSAESQKSG